MILIVDLTGKRQERAMAEPKSYLQPVQERTSCAVQLVNYFTKRQ